MASSVELWNASDSWISAEELETIPGELFLHVSALTGMQLWKRAFSHACVCVCFGHISIRHTSHDSYNILSQGEEAGLSSKGPGEVLWELRLKPFLSSKFVLSIYDFFYLLFIISKKI